MNKEEKIKKLLMKNHGYITTSDIINLGISKPLIQNLIDKGLIERVSHGLYMDSQLFKDECYILQKKYPFAILSYNTALDILNLSNRTPMNLDVTIPRGKTIRGNYCVHYVTEKYYNIGIIEAVSPLGNHIKVYNAERCICDMLRSENEFDLELQNRILNYYWHSKEKNIDLLLEYAKIFNIYDKVNTIVEVMMKW